MGDGPLPAMKRVDVELQAVRLSGSGATSQRYSGGAVVSVPEILSIAAMRA